MTKNKLPAALSAAYAWTEAASELGHLRSLTDEALDVYCRESAENWRENPSGAEVTAADLHDLHDWLCAEVA